MLVASLVWPMSQPAKQSHFLFTWRKMTSHKSTFLNLEIPLCLVRTWLPAMAVQEQLVKGSGLRNVRRMLFLRTGLLYFVLFICMANLLWMWEENEKQTPMKSWKHKERNGEMVSQQPGNAGSPTVLSTQLSKGEDVDCSERSNSSWN